MSRQRVVEARGVCFSYPDGTQALDGLDFEACAGEFVVILAANGSGKSTLLKVLMGLLKPSRGKVQVNSRSVASFSPAELYSTMGMVFQNPDDQLFSATVEEDVAFGPRNLGLPEAEVETRVAQALQAVGALALRARPVHHTSFGERKRVCVAGVLAMKPSVLILDEPTAGLDPGGEASMLNLLADLNRNHGVTIVMSTHSIDLLPLFAHRIYVLQNGHVRASGPPAAVFADEAGLHEASLRLPHVAALFEQMRRLDGVATRELPLTVGEARRILLDRLPLEVLQRTAVAP